MNYYVIGDPHFGHENIIKFCNRPFNDVNHMNETLVENWNSVVTEKDLVYVLGDMIWKNPNWMKTILDKLNGDIILIRGGHDRWNVLKGVKDRFIEIRDYLEMDYVSKIDQKKYSFVMMHYPIAQWHRSYHGAIHLHGHSHNNHKATGKIIDVGVDNPLCNYTPFHIEELIKIANKIPMFVDHHSRNEGGEDENQSV